MRVRTAIRLALCVAFLAACSGETTAPATTLEPTTTTTTTPPPTTIPAPASDTLTLSLVQRIANDDLQPKSIVHSGHGLFFAQNMMYRHNVAVFDRDGNTVAVIDDAVNLADFGLDTKGRSPRVKGSPVEVAFTSDGRFAYVSNYKMYGKGWNPVADDSCQSRDWDPGYVYRIDTTTFAIDQVIEVGAVPKYLQVSPDDRTLVVSNFCSQDASIVDLATARETQRLFVGLHPRGIAITRDSLTAYVTVMGGANSSRSTSQPLPPSTSRPQASPRVTSCCHQATTSSTSRTTRPVRCARSTRPRVRCSVWSRPAPNRAPW